MSKDTGWLKVLTIIISIAVIVLGPIGYVIHQQDEIKESQSDLETEMKVLKERLKWSRIIPMGTRTLSATGDWTDLIDHLREVNEFENKRGD